MTEDDIKYTMIVDGLSVDLRSTETKTTKETLRKLLMKHLRLTGYLLTVSGMDQPTLQHVMDFVSTLFLGVMGGVDPLDDSTFIKLVGTGASAIFVYPDSGNKGLIADIRDAKPQNDVVSALLGGVYLMRGLVGDIDSVMLGDKVIEAIGSGRAAALSDIANDATPRNERNTSEIVTDQES